MITRAAHAVPRPGQTPGLAALRDVVTQSERSGAVRCAAVLYTDRLPPALVKPHHLRLARQALQSLTSADRAQVFDLSNGRVAVVWRGRGGTELEEARRSLDHLLSGQPQLLRPGGRELLSAYDLPRQATSLLDELADAVGCAHESRLPIDLKILARLEATLARADLTCFARVRPIVAVRDPGCPQGRVAPVWEEHYFAIDDLAASLSPERDLRGDPWLFSRLTRTLDKRMLALLVAPGELVRRGPFAININAATILSPSFLRFDTALPNHLRSEVTLILNATDILADGAAFAFAQKFARARLYRLALADVSRTLLDLVDVQAAGIDLLHVALTPAMRAAGAAWLQRLPSGSGLVLTNIDRPSDLRWALDHGFRLGRGALFRA